MNSGASAGSSGIFDSHLLDNYSDDGFSEFSTSSVLSDDGGRATFPQISHTKMTAEQVRLLEVVR